MTNFLSQMYLRLGQMGFSGKCECCFCSSKQKIDYKTIFQNSFNMQKVIVAQNQIHYIQIFIKYQNFLKITSFPQNIFRIFGQQTPSPKITKQNNLPKNIQLMDQQNKISPQESTHFDYIISALHKKRKKNQPQEEANLSKLYETMNNVVSGLDESINSCKKYNEAKIHRKYEIILNDQAKRIRFLEEKVKEEHRARSPSKKYIEDLLDKLINFKFQNEVLSKNNAQLTHQNTELKKRLQIYEDHAPINDKKQEPKQEKYVIENVSTMGAISGTAIQHEIVSYIRLKNQLRKHQNQQKTKFQRFLIKIKQKSSLWSMRQFLQSIDKWVVQFLAAEPQKIESPSQDTLPPALHKTAYNGGIGNRIAAGMMKNQIRNRKTFSYRTFANNKSVYEGVLR